MVSGRVLNWFLIGNLAVLATAFLEIAMALSLQLILNAIGFQVLEVSLPSFLQGWEPTTTGLFLIILGIITGRAIFTFCTKTSSNFAYVLIQSRLRMAVFYEILQRFQPVFLSAAEINFRNTEVAGKAGGFISAINQLFNAAFQGIILLATMLWISWTLTLISLAIFGMAGIGILLINRQIKKSAVKLPSAQRKIVSGIERIARNWLLVRILRTQDTEYDQQINNIISYAKLDLRITLMATLNSVFPVLVGSYLITSLILLNIYWLSIEAGSFVSFLYIFLRFQQIVSSGTGVFGIITANQPHFEIAANLLTELDANERKNAVKPIFKMNFLGRGAKYTHIPRFTDEHQTQQLKPPAIRLSQISFGYGEDESPVLTDLNVSISAGQQFAIVGPSGSGKSTLLGIILGILIPNQGSATIDEMQPSDFFSNQAIHLGYVGAESFLIEGTIAENIRYGARKSLDTSDEACLRALNRAHLDDLVEANTQILDHRINENGEGLSAGQKQRLTLARALLGDPQLLILDEASANLDSETEANIARTISELKGTCTTIIVSHRPGMLTYADKILSMDKTWDTNSEKPANGSAV
jgi:ABC-type multidrug transport system fused ATPase/permease subunit